MDTAPAKFDHLFQVNERHVRNYCARRVDRQVVDDVLNDTFAVAWRKIDLAPDGVRNRLTDLTHFEAGAHVLFLMNNGTIETVDETPDLVRLTVGGDSPFGNWVVANPPGDFDRIWNTGTGRGDRGPVLDEESIALFDAHLTEYIAASAGSSATQTALPRR